MLIVYDDRTTELNSGDLNYDSDPTENNDKVYPFPLNPARDGGLAGYSKPPSQKSQITHDQCDYFNEISSVHVSSLNCLNAVGSSARVLKHSLTENTDSSTHNFAPLDSVAQ
ncbi:hypothetical protein Ahy_B10g105820 isoform C [Arachis hypogaea]|uniref:Uncharacterized protein n=1 Tax=Arachis hypogaea TaxID=3818 RepID=A0A444X902_ARAHY|nr:hypothetical protein Ahy_B10g105820 isoform C [Arachis hypogaea]